MSTRGPVPALVAALLVFATLTAMPLPAVAAEEDDLTEAQRQANAAAAELSDAEEEIARADDAVSHLQGRVAAVERRLESVRDRVRQLAVRLYVDGTGTLSRLLRMSDANQIIRAQQFGHVLAGTSTDALRQYRVDREDLKAELEALERKQEDRADALENLRRRQADAIEEIERLTRIAREARVAEQARAAPQAPANQEPARRAEGSAPGPAAAPTREASPTADQPSPQPSSPPDATGAEEEAPAPAAPAPAVSGEWVCPVQGPLAFSDDYGASRGGGYSHQGNDILAARGTPVVANVSGVVTQRNGSVSGLAYYLQGDDGNEYFGAHLDSFGASGRVSAGTQIGTVGTSGDAEGGPPHLHFEIHPGGGAPINPYPILRRYC